MKIVCTILTLAVVLTGCSTAQTFERVEDELLEPVMSQRREMTVTVPDSASTAVMESEDGGKLYLCDGYIMTVQTLDGGDMNRTIQTLCGYDADAVTVLQTRDGAWQRYEWVWISAGEGGEELGHAAVLDDGCYHYCLTVMADAEDVPALEPEWEALLGSFAIG